MVFWISSAWVSVGAAIGVEAARGNVVERCLVGNGVSVRRKGVMLVVVESTRRTRLVGMRRASLGTVRESMSRLLVLFV